MSNTVHTTPPCGVDVQLRPHQHDLLRTLLDPEQPHAHRRLFVAPTGSGKTITAIVAGVCLLARHVVNAVHIVVPKSVVPQFRSEVERLVPVVWRRAFTVFTHATYFRRRSKSSRNAKHNQRFLLVVDEAHAVATRVVCRASGSVRTRRTSSTSSHTHKAIYSGARSYYAMEAAQRASALLLLTATPLQNSPNDLINLLCMLHGQPYDTFYNEPLVAGVRVHVTKQQKQYLRTGNNSALQQSNATQLMRTYVRAMAPLLVFANVARGDDYPSETHKTVRLTMDAAYLRLYNAIERDHVDEFRRRLEQQQHLTHKTTKRRTSSKGLDSPLQCVFQPDNIDAFYLKLRHVVNGCTEFIVSKKITYAVETVTQAHAHRRNVIVYSTFIDGGLTLIAKQLRKKSIPFVDIIGERTLHARKMYAKRFNDPNDATCVLLLSKAGCEGLDLKGVRDVVLLEPHFHTERLKQVVGRAVRFRSHSHLPPDERHVTVHHLLLCKPHDDGDTWAAIEKHNEQQIHELLRTYAQRAKARTLKLRMHAANKLLFTHISNEYWALHGASNATNPFRTVPIDTTHTRDNDQSLYVYFTDRVQVNPHAFGLGAYWDAFDDATSDADATTPSPQPSGEHYDAIYVLKHPPKRASVDIILHQMAERKERLNATHLQLLRRG